MSRQRLPGANTSAPGSRSVENVETCSARNAVAVAEDASQMVSSLIQLTLDEETLLGEDSGKKLRLQEVKKTELSLRLLRDDLPTSLRKIYAETGEYLTGLGEILSTAEMSNSSEVLSERMKNGDVSVVKDSLSMIDKRLDRLEISEQDSRGKYADTEARCVELNNRAKVGQLGGEGNARLARLMKLREHRYGSLYAVALVGVIFAVCRLFLLDMVYMHLKGDTFSFVRQVMELASWLLVIVAVISLVYYGIEADRVHKQCLEVESKSRQWIKDLRKMQKFAALPKECFTTAEGIVKTVKRNLQAVLDVVNLSQPSTEDDARRALIEGQLSVFWAAVKEQKKRLEQLKKSLLDEDSEREKLQKEFTKYDFSEL